MKKKKSGKDEIFEYIFLYSQIYVSVSNVGSQWVSDYHLLETEKLPL